MRPFSAFLLWFLRFSGLKMSIASIISTVFFSDCNTFATPRDSIYGMVESFEKYNWVELQFQFISGLRYRIAGKGLIELFDSLVCL
jgi:hypothetical protein